MSVVVHPQNLQSPVPPRDNTKRPLEAANDASEEQPEMASDKTDGAQDPYWAPEAQVRNSPRNEPLTHENDKNEKRKKRKGGAPRHGQPR